MLIVPDVTTAVVDPATDETTISLICDIVDPITRKPYSRDPRAIAKKAEEHLNTTEQFDTSYWGPEAEFFVFDDVRFEQNAHSGFYFVDSHEAAGTAAAATGRTSGIRSHTSWATSPCAARHADGHPVGDGAGDEGGRTGQLSGDDGKARA
jgi:glutamine synthetase